MSVRGSINWGKGNIMAEGERCKPKGKSGRNRGYYP